MARVLVTGIGGCIGAWTAKRLLEEGHDPVGTDLSDDLPRLRLVGAEGQLPVHRLDARDEEGVGKLLDAERPDAVIHLAALQIPFCKADPAGCVGVNVAAVMLLLEAARERGFGLAYASSAAVYGPDQGRTLSEHEGVRPHTLYGVFKFANEEMGRVYHQDYGVTSA
ncbi:MAG: NAD-dependent epimerase/dehydratase family protein, partial [Actinomycetota bacterium]